MTHVQINPIKIIHTNQTKANQIIIQGQNTLYLYIKRIIYIHNTQTCAQTPRHRYTCTQTHTHRHRCNIIERQKHTEIIY